MLDLPKDAHAILGSIYDQRFQLYTAGGDSLDLRNHWLDCACVLVCGGPSLSSMNLDALRASGIPTMALNNAWAIYRPDLWVGIDPASSFVDAGWKDPRILKLAPTSEVMTRLRAKIEDGNFRTLGLTPGRCPNTLFFKRSVGFNPHTFLTQPVASYGQRSATVDLAGVTGARSVMLPALRLLHYFGFRRVYIIGADFNMPIDGAHYATGETHAPAVARGNNSTYAALNTRFVSLRPHFEEAGFHVYNSTPGGNLTAFERRDFGAVLHVEKTAAVEGADATGWYPKHNAQRSNELTHYLTREGGPYSTWHQRVYAAAASLLPHPGCSVIDVGSGAGVGLDILRRSGWEGLYHGVDLEPVPPATPDPKATFTAGDFMSADLPVCDVCLCVEVFEHLQGYPPAALDRLLSLTRGVLILSTPDKSRNAHGRFTPAELRATLGTLKADVFEQAVGGTVVYFCRRRHHAGTP